MLYYYGLAFCAVWRGRFEQQVPGWGGEQEAGSSSYY